MIIPEDKQLVISKNMLIHYPYTFEAIIRDCVAVCRSLDYSDDHWLVHKCADAILQRYGLEEK